MFKIHGDSKGRYGSRRVHDELRKLMVIGRHKVARLMRKHGLRAKVSKRFKVTTESKHNEKVDENLLNREFQVSQPNRVWVGDITYLKTVEGWLYLAVVIDLFSRRVVGWKLSSRSDQKLTLDALNVALQRQPERGFIFHSDRGVQYAAKAYRKRVEAFGGLQSMSRKGDCWDNAVAESFFATLKRESQTGEVVKTKRETTLEVLDYLRWYNAERLHLSNHYFSPNQYERRHSELTEKQAA
jgi:transposase InsO family protein